MYCPNCGAQSSADQKFCRACGLKLEKVSLLIVEQLPAGAVEESSPEEIARLLKKQQRIERLLVGLGVTAFTVFVLSIVWALVFKIIIGKGEVLQGSIFLGLILSAVVGLILVIYRESVMEKLAKRSVAGEKALPGAAQTSNLLHESRIVPASSVTDRTTELLAAERKRSTSEL